jgi:hypothetical protein
MTNGLTTIAPAMDNFALSAASSTSLIVGERLRFVKVGFFIGKGNSEQLPFGTELEARDMNCAWTKFEAGRVAEQYIGWPMLPREELGDLDESQWPLNVDGEPVDPWSNQKFLCLVSCDNGRDFTFITASWGGRAAVETLARQIANVRAGHPGAIAIVKLEIGAKTSPKYGAVPAPKFTIVRWVGIEQRPPQDSFEFVPNERERSRSLPDDSIPFISADPALEPYLRRRGIL